MARRNRVHVASQPSDGAIHAAANAMVHTYPDYSSGFMGPTEDGGSAYEDAPRSRATTTGASDPNDLDASGANGEPPMSKYAADLLSAPQVVLLLSASRESQEAFRLLEEARVRFAAYVAHDEPAPSVQWGGSLFEGLAAIKDVAATLQKLDRDLQKNLPAKTPPGFGPPDSRISQWMERERERQLVEARAVLRKVLQQSGAAGN